jgi:CO/xanthine dehydrogenase Mo-binding subunit
LRQDQVECHDVSTGGGFGSKSHVSEHEVIAALLTVVAGRPALLTLDREEEFAATKPRHAFRVEVRAHGDGHGRICWFDADLKADTDLLAPSKQQGRRTTVPGYSAKRPPAHRQVRARRVDRSGLPAGQVPEAM